MRKIVIIGLIIIFFTIDAPIFTVESADFNIIKIKDIQNIEINKIDNFLTIYDFNGITSP